MQIKHCCYSVFTGKALSPSESLDYVKVKAAVLYAYEFVPEAYRQKFKKWKKGQKQSRVEFVSNISAHFALPLR